jgi:DNA repair protein RadA
MDEIKKIASQHKVRLLVVDSIINHFRAEYTGRGVLAERQQIIAKYMSELKAFAINNDACVIVSNQVAARPDAFFGDPNNVVGGNVVGHASAYILKVRKGKAGKRIFSLIKAPDMPSGECVAVVDDRGVADA